MTLGKKTCAADLRCSKEFPHVSKWDKESLSRWLSWGRGAALGQGPPREEPQRPLPPAPLDSAFMRVYFQVCTQMCGFWEGPGGGSEGGCAERFEPQPPRPGGKELAFPSGPDGRGGLLALAPAAGSADTAASPPGPPPVMPCRLIGSLEEPQAASFRPPLSGGSPGWRWVALTVHCALPRGPGPAAERDSPSLPKPGQLRPLCLFRERGHFISRCWVSDRPWGAPALQTFPPAPRHCVFPF